MAGDGRCRRHPLAQATRLLAFPLNIDVKAAVQEFLRTCFVRIEASNRGGRLHAGAVSAGFFTVYFVGVEVTVVFHNRVAVAPNVLTCLSCSEIYLEILLQNIALKYILFFSSNNRSQRLLYILFTYGALTRIKSLTLF